MLVKIAKELSTPRRGLSPNYSEFHVILTFFILGECPMGRKALAERLALGEGTARTLIEKLQGMGLVRTSPTGCHLTKKGNEMLADFKKRVLYRPKIETGMITLGKANSAVLIRDSAKLIKSGMEQRDAAVSAGTMGASTIILDETGPRIPTITADENMRTRMRVLCEDVCMQAGDVLVIGTGETEGEAERAAWAAAYTILRKEGCNYAEN
ncbi:MAG: hypothetical protein QMC77_00620 [Methanocellales archaeon]|nr:hypothetical protein [Methanocellales archaeon]MDI6902230.1 hypothetical protein [Methanocellales archaeon]